MNRELIAAAVILACIVAPYQAFEVETPGMGHLDVGIFGPTEIEQIGYVGVHLSGALREFQELTDGQLSVVLGFELANETSLQITFYCVNGTLLSTTDPTTTTSRAQSGEHNPFSEFGLLYVGLTYCEASQLPYHNGTQLNVMGTLMTPSQWQPNLSTPTIVFSGDFYVMEIEP